jgi:hypothetical protein
LISEDFNGWQRKDSMKKQMLFLTSILISIALSACKYEQNPLTEYPKASEVSIPVDSKKALETATTTTTTLKPIIEYVDREVPVIKDRIVVKEVEKEVIKYVVAEEEQNWESAKLFQIHSVNELTYVVGEESTATIRATVLHGNATFSLKILNMPSNASDLTLVETENNTRTFQFKWKPEVKYLMSNGKMTLEKREKLKVQLNLESFEMADKKKEAKIREAFNAISTTKELDMVVRRNSKIPKLIPSQNIPTQIQEGQVIPFSISVEAPGTSSENPPVLLIEDRKEFVGNLYEGSGARFINTSTSKPIEQVGENQWIFNLELDTTTEAIPPQINRQKQVVEGANSVILRFGLRVLSNGVSSDTSVKRFEIRLNPKMTSQTPVQTEAVSAPVSAQPIPTPRQKPVVTPRAKPSASDQGSNGTLSIPTPRPKPTI